MYNIRIKKSPSNKHTGDQEGFGLVRNLAAMQTNNSEVSVNDKLGAVPREKATLEAEGGESVFGDINRDGNMELMHFVGKRHTDGGIPADIPEGSFIFSDTKSLTIKDKEVIEKLFGLPFRKQGYTPGEISRKFDINKYVQILKSDDADELTKRTAAEMLRANKEKLGILAFIQESMKGFPDGIPTIAEEVLSKMGVNPEQLIQEAQPQPQQQGQGQEPMQPMSPEEEQMMMAMQQGQGAPMEEGMMMPEQRFGGLTRFVDGGGNNPKVQKLRKAGYNADALSNAQIQVKVPGVTMDPFIFNESDSKTLDSIVRRPVRGFEDSPLEQGKIYTFKSRPGTYYKIGPDGRLHVKNENTGWKYTVMNDPTGERRRNLELGVENGMTKEFETQEKVLPKNYKSGTKAFLNRIEETKFKNSGGIEKAAYDMYQHALKSKDPKKMLEIANELETNKNFDIDYSVGWLPFTNQDKISDMAAVLSDEAAKIVGKKTKNELNKATVNITSKVDDIVKSFTKQYNETPADQYDKKLKLAKQIQRYKEIKSELSSPYFKSWKDMNNLSDTPWNDKGFMELINHVNELHSNVFKSKGTVVSNKDLYNKMLNYKFMEDMGNETVYPENLFDFDGTKSSGTKGNVKQIIYNGETYRLDRNENQNVVYKKVDNEMGDFEVDPSMYPILDQKFSELNGKPIKGIYTPTKRSNYSGDVTEDVSESPVVEMSPKEKLRQPVIQERKPITLKSKPGASTVVTPEDVVAPQPIYTEEQIKSFFQKYGGQIDEYEDGGTVDEYGYLTLPRFDLGGFTKDPTPLTDGNFKYKKTLTDGTVIVKIVKPDGTEIQQFAKNDKFNNGAILNYNPNENILRGLNEPPMTADNMNDAEKEEMAKKWGSSPEAKDAYINFNNRRQEFRQDADLRKAMKEQFDIIRKDNRYYTFKDKGLTEYTKDLESMTDQDLFDALMRMDETNLRLQSTGLDVKNSGQRTAASEYAALKKKNPTAAAAFLKKYGSDPNFNFTNSKTLDHIAAHPELKGIDLSKAYKSQGAYQAYYNALQDPKYKDLYEHPLVGVADEKTGVLPADISGMDKAWNDTTLGQNTGYKKKAVVKPVVAKEESTGAKWYCIEKEDGTKTVVQATKNAEGVEVPPPGSKDAEGYADENTAKAACSVQTLDAQLPGRESNGWFMPDIVNYATALGQRIPFTMPTLRQMQSAPTGYDLTNPIQKLAFAQSENARTSNQLFNTMDPNTAAAALLGEGPASLEAGNRAITDTETSNLGVTNQAYNTIGNRMMQTDQINTQLRGKYDTEVATVLEEKARDENAKKALLSRLYETGFENEMKDNAMRVKYPQARHVNRITGHFDGYGGGRSDLFADTQGSTGGDGDVSEQANAKYQKVYDASIAAGDKEEVAKSKADAAMKQVYNDYNYYRSDKNRRNSSYYDSSPSWHKFGGSIYSPSPDYDFFLGQ